MTDKPMTDAEALFKLHVLASVSRFKALSESESKELHEAHLHIATRLAQQPAQTSLPPFDVEHMLTVCIPGGGACDPQDVADAIREYLGALDQQPARGGELDAERYRKLRSIRVNPYAVLPVGVELDTYVDALAQPRTEQPATCTCPSGDGSLRWPCPTHSPQPRTEQPAACTKCGGRKPIEGPPCDLCGGKQPAEAYCGYCDNNREVLSTIDDENDDTLKPCPVCRVAGKYSSEQQAAVTLRADSKWLTDIRRCLEDVATQMRATGQGDSRFVQLLARLPVEQTAAEGRGEVVAEVVEGPGEHRPRVLKQVSDLPVVGTKLYAATPPRADAVDEAMVERVAVAIHNEARRGTFRGPWGGQFSDYQNRIRDQARAALAAAINQGEKS